MKSSRIFLLLLLGLLILPIELCAQSSSKVRALEKERKSLQQSIEKATTEIRKLKEDKNKKQKEASILKKQVSERARLVEVLDLEIHSMNQHIDSLGTQISELQQLEDRNKKSYARSLRSLQRQKNKSDRILFVLSSQSFDQGVRRIRFVSQYAEAHKKATLELRQTQETLRNKQDEIASVKRGKSDLLVLREREKNQLQQQAQAKQSEIQSLSGQQKKLEAQLRKKQKQAKALDDKIQRQIALEVEAAEKRNKQRTESQPEKKSNRRNPSTPTATKKGYSMNAEELNLAKTFAANRGKLPPPVNSRYSVHSHFGINQHASLSQVRTNNAGVDLAVSAGTSAVAVFEGVVTSVFVVPGFNTSVILRHGNYLTVYSNLVQVSVAKGQKVSTGQKLGIVALDDDSGKYILKFQVWHERQKVNPEQWIR